MIKGSFYMVCLFSWTGLFAQVKNIETPNGLNLFYYPNGQLASEGTMIDGKPDGYWKSYYVDGTLKSEGLRKAGFLDSVWVFYDENGFLKSQIDYRDGKKNGYYYAFEKTPNSDSTTKIFLKSKEIYMDNARHGTCEYYFPNGQISDKINYYKGLKQGLARIFDRHGTCIALVEYKNGVEIDRELINRYVDSTKHGVWKEFYPNGRIKSERTYHYGLLNGLEKSYDITGELIYTYRYQNGVLKDTSVVVENQIDIVESFYSNRDENGVFIKKSSGGFIDGIPIGIHRTYDSLGRVNSSKLYDSKGNLLGEGIVNEEGDRLGDWVFYYEGGQIKSKGSYSENRRVGQWFYFYINENIEQKGSFTRGLPNGLWTWYFENGAIKREEYYYLGKEQGDSFEYDEEGIIVAQGKFNEGLKEGLWEYNYYFHREKGNYKDGLKDGIWEYTYKNGNLYFRGSFVMDNPDGKHVYYYKNGKNKEVQYYFIGRRIKNWELYDEQGILKTINTYIQDSLVKINGIDIIIN